MDKDRMNTRMETASFSPVNEEVQDILGRPPSWIVRRGTLLFLIVLALLITGSWLFRYPDIVRAHITLTTENPPLPVVALSSGKIKHLFAGDTQRVRQGEVLAVIENPAVYDDVVSMERIVSGLEESMSGNGWPDPLPSGRTLNLGEVQPSYARFATDHQQYINYLQLDYYGKRSASVAEEIKKYRIYYENLINQKNVLARDLHLSYQQFLRDSSLYARGVIAAAEFERAESVYLGKKHSYEQAVVNLSQASIQITELEQEMLDLGLKRAEQEALLRNTVLESYRNLLASLADWKLRYVLCSPGDGKVSYSRYWREGQYVLADHPVMIVVPGLPGDLLGRIRLTARRSGKVHLGQKVLIKLDNFPYLEYGMPEGVVKNISLSPDDNEQLVEIVFPQGLRTTYHRQLEFRNEMTGMAEIITDERPLLLRFVDPFRYLWTKNLRRQD